jgi:hypothetical protein
MPYVHRKAGVITGLTRWPNGSTELLPESDPEVIAFKNPPPPTNDEIYDEVIQNHKVLKALVLCLNDGTIVPGANVSGAELKSAIKDKM